MQKITDRRFLSWIIRTNACIYQNHGKKVCHDEVQGSTNQRKCGESVLATPCTYRFKVIKVSRVSFHIPNDHLTKIRPQCIQNTKQISVSILAFVPILLVRSHFHRTTFPFSTKSQFMLLWQWTHTFLLIKSHAFEMYAVSLKKELKLPKFRRIHLEKM